MLQGIILKYKVQYFLLSSHLFLMTDSTIFGSGSGVLFSSSLVVFQHCLLFAEQAVATANESKFEGQNSASQYFP